MFSATCLIACVLLIVLWVRSYWWDDVIIAPGDGSQRFGSSNGWTTFRWKELRRLPNLRFKNWQVTSHSVKELEQKYARMQIKIRSPQFGFVDAGAIQFPYWLPAMVCAGMSVAPWLRWQYSIRTLLLAITAVAVVLGSIAWAMY